MTTLARYDAARAALEAAVRVDEVKEIHDISAAMRAYARQAKDREMEANAAELRERAERRLGELLVAQREAGGFARGGRPKTPAVAEVVSPPPITLADMGIDHKLSHRAQKKAGIAAAAFDLMVEHMREDIVSGKRSADVLKGEGARMQQDARRNLQQALSDQSALLAGGRRYPVIYADPATKFRAGIGNRSIENHYRTMTIDDLCALDVPARCLPDCQAFIWSTVPQLANTISRILPSWGGFEYSSHCMWDKTSPDFERELGTGLVFRNQHEVLIYATRGRPPGPAIQPPSIYRERKREHSRKPDYYRDMIRQMVRGLPVLELFARVDAEHPLPEGFAAWGNESSPASESLDPATGEITCNTEAA